MLVELVGIIASLIILTSTVFQSTSYRRNIIMRCINATGSIVFIIYGIMISSLSIIILNSTMIVVASIHIYLLIRKILAEKEANTVDYVDIWINKDENLQIIKDGVLGVDWMGSAGWGRWELILDQNGTPHIYTEHMDQIEDKEFSKKILRAILDKAIIEE